MLSSNLHLKSQAEGFVLNSIHSLNVKRMEIQIIRDGK